MKTQRFNLEACLAKAHMAIQDGRTDEGVEELRRGILEAAKLSPLKGRGQVERILSFASENEVFGEVEETLHEESLRRWLFGPD